MIILRGSQVIAAAIILFSLIFIRFSTCETRRLNRALHVNPFFLCKIKLYSLVFGYNSCSSFRVMPFVRSLKHAYVLEKFVFTPSTSSCFVVFSMCQLSAFWMAVLRSSRNLPFYWKCSVQLAWRTLTTFNNRSPTVTRTCVHVREWKVISLMSEFFLLFWCCYVWTKQTTPIHSQFFYLIFFSPCFK